MHVPIYRPGWTHNSAGHRVDLKRTNRLHYLLRLGFSADAAVCQVIREMGH